MKLFEKGDDCSLDCLPGTLVPYTTDPAPSLPTFSCQGNPRVLCYWSYTLCLFLIITGLLDCIVGDWECSILIGNILIPACVAQIIGYFFELDGRRRNRETEEAQKRSLPLCSLGVCCMSYIYIYIYIYIFIYIYTYLFTYLLYIYIYMYT